MNPFDKVVRMSHVHGKGREVGVGRVYLRIINKSGRQVV